MGGNEQFTLKEMIRFSILFVMKGPKIKSLTNNNQFLYVTEVSLILFINSKLVISAGLDLDVV